MPPPRGFATQVIAPVGDGQPRFVSVPVDWVSTVVAAHPVAWNLPFAGVQLLLGEGLSRLANGDASLITWAPGSALLYALLAAAVWPHKDSSPERPAPWLPFAWAMVWVGAAVFQSCPARTAGRRSSALTAGTNAAPAWLSNLDGSVSAVAAHHGPLLVTLLAEAEALVGVGALARRTRTAAVALGLALTLTFWVLGQDLGELYSGQASDPNSGPLLAVMAIALWPTAAGPRSV